MTQPNLAIARALLDQIGGGADPDVIAAGMDEAVVLKIAGDEKAMPWIGEQVGRDAVARFFRDQRALLTSRLFRVDDILTSDRRAVVLGALIASLNSNGRTIETDFAIVLTIVDDVIARFEMLEESYALSVAAR